MEDIIYLDNAATTKMRKEVYEVMAPYFMDMYGNASGIHFMARQNRKAINISRQKVANVLNVEPKEIYFTSGGTEANNWAITGIAEANKHKGNHIITSSIEHHSVLHPCENLEKNGFNVTYLPVSDKGFICINDLKKAITQETILISIMFANNEIGTLQPIKEIGEIAKKHNIVFHTDAVQALGYVPIDVKLMNIDMLTISGHKIYGPKGVGALYIKEGVKISPFIYGGSQERNRRAGTENIPGIIALGKAIELIKNEMQDEILRLTYLRNMALDGIINSIPHCKLNGALENRLPGNLNISFKFLDGQDILLMLESKGLIASSGAACTSGALDPSHVLIALGLSYKDAYGSLRITIGKYNTEKDIKFLIESLREIIPKLINM